MQTQLIVVGKTTGQPLLQLIGQYRERIARHMAFAIEELPALRNTRHLSPDQQIHLEGQALLARFRPGDHIVLLDEHGLQMRSLQLARWLQQKQTAVPRRLVFVIGGPYGFSDAVRAAAAEQLSLSPLTFSHQLVRLLFVEQLYRAQTIIRGEPYHHE